MAEKRVSVRLAAVGGRQVRAELEGVGEAGKRCFGRLSREMEAANARLAGFSRRVKVAAAAAVAQLLEAGGAEACAIAKPNGLTPLMVAAMHGHVAAARRLLWAAAAQASASSSPDAAGWPRCCAAP
mgnify:CR=1 FL=1